MDVRPQDSARRRRAQRAGRATGSAALTSLRPFLPLYGWPPAARL
jgi:hypothetical protein